MKLVGGVEGGGTKFICGIGTENGEILAETQIPTTTPDETLGQAITFFQTQSDAVGPLDAIGIASFGPLGLNKTAKTFGRILTTPKPGWSDVDLIGPFRSGLRVPIALDTDVNGAALGEWRWGAGQGLTDFIYLTIGTGIGGGGLINGALMHGLLHPEMGHIALPRLPEPDDFVGICPFHGDCFEGLASGVAMEARWGAKPESLPPKHLAWELEADYIALALRTYICTLAPQRIIIGGGVAQQPQLLPLVREKTLAALNGYIQSPVILENIDTYIVSPALGHRAGLLGAFALAQSVI